MAVAYRHSCTHLRHPSLIKVPLDMASSCYHPRTLTCMRHAADCMTKQESVGPLPAEPALGESKSLWFLRTIQ